MYVLVLPYLLGIIYSTSFFKKLIKKTGSGIIEKIYNTKIVTAFGWLIPMVLIPYLNSHVPPLKIVSLLLYYFTFVFLRQILIDLVAFQGDLILGRETLPTWLGIKKSSTAAYSLAGLSAIALALTVFYYGTYNYFILLIPLIVYAMLLKKIGKTDYLISLRYEFIIESNFIFFIIMFFMV